MATPTYTSAVQAFKKASTWLTAEHEPALVMLSSIAYDLDHGDRTPALIGQFGLAYRSLLKLAPRKVAAVSDPLEDALP